MPELNVERCTEASQRHSTTPAPPASVSTLPGRWSAARRQNSACCERGALQGSCAAPTLAAECCQEAPQRLH